MKRYDYWTTARVLGLLFGGTGLTFWTANWVLYNSVNRGLQLIGIILVSCGAVSSVFDWIDKRGRKPTKLDKNQKQGEPTQT